MGMAAGQARLLSITSRMSDNELRAQIISNNKMRLATQSSQVSENYVTALNKAQMMFTNYDADNNISYQQLTFNALSAYNPYNNQYILSNASGQVVLSETDAQNYVNANGSVEKFLNAYGLENTTSYFESLETHMGTLSNELKIELGLPNDYLGVAIQYKTGAIDDQGNERMGYFGAVDTDGNPISDSKALADYIQALYEGNENNPIHPGYQAAMASDGYYNYSKLLGEFEGAYNAHLENILDKMTETFTNIKGDGQSLSEIKSAVDTADYETMKSTVFPALLNFIGNAESYGITGNTYFSDLKNVINTNSGDFQTSIISKADGYSIERTDTSSTIPNYPSTYPKTIKIKDKSGDVMIFEKTSETEGEGKLYITNENGDAKDENGNPITKDIKYDSTGKWSYNTNTKDENGNTITITSYLKFPDSYFDECPDDWKIEQELPNDLENMQNIANQVISSLNNSFYSVWDPSNAKFCDPNDDIYKRYLEAAKDLVEHVFGSKTAISDGDYPNLDDVEWIHEKLKTTGTEDKKNAFEKIYDIYILDCIQNTYGEPKYAWIDTSNKFEDPSSYNENGDAKAQWYENLFKRVQKGGFTVLKDGLASSPEWIQFAFESGVVTMEQLDELKNWQPLIYSNCSDITEKTCDADIAKAEAEYKSAMNKIENKDKRYDLELKNIDTEHSSLQTEYDSIKTAIDKNIDRTFKLYM